MRKRGGEGGREGWKEGESEKGRERGRVGLSPSSDECR